MLNGLEVDSRLHIGDEEFVYFFFFFWKMAGFDTILNYRTFDPDMDATSVGQTTRAKQTSYPNGGPRFRKSPGNVG